MALREIPGGEYLSLPLQESAQKSEKETKKAYRKRVEEGKEREPHSGPGNL
jgi:hypothetical protein